jgi:hypothetical protein
MATTNNKRLKNMNFDYSRSKIEGFVGSILTPPAPEITGENKGIDAIFPIL